MHILLFLNIKFSRALISTTISRCPVNSINLAATIVVFRSPEYDSELRRDFQITISERDLDVLRISTRTNTVNIAVNFCKTYSNVSMHIQRKSHQNLRAGDFQKKISFETALPYLISSFLNASVFDN